MEWKPDLLEALRLGVIPPVDAGLMTVGREDIQATLRQDLDQLVTGGALRFLIGEYGIGKSHLLEWLAREALRSNCLVARTSLDDRDITFAHPKRIYRSLMSNLSYPHGLGKPEGLEPLLTALLGRAKLNHQYLDAAVHHYARARHGADFDLTHRILDWLEGNPFASSEDWNQELAVGRGPRLLALPDYRTFAHVYTYLLGGIAKAAQLVGYAGLVVLIDEAEFYQALTAENRQHARAVLSGLCLACIGPGRVCFKEQELEKGGQAVHRKLPWVFDPAQPLFVAVALTPVPAIHELLSSLVPVERLTVELRNLTVQDHAELFERVVAAYPLSDAQRRVLAPLTGPVARALHAGVASSALPNPRATLKVMVEFLDMLRYRPEDVTRFVTDLAAGLFPAPQRR